MAKKVTPPPQKPRRGLIVVRNMDLDVWERFSKYAERRAPPLKKGPALEEVLREFLDGKHF